MTSDHYHIPSLPGEPAGGRYGLPSRTFSSYAWQIHQRVAYDADFRSVCEEHEEALRALEHFRASKATQQRIAEYASLVEELQQDILRELRRS